MKRRRAVKIPRYAMLSAMLIASALLIYAIFLFIQRLELSVQQQNHLAYQFPPPQPVLQNQSASDCYGKIPQPFLYIYSEFCQNCRLSTPIVDELISEGYDIMKIDILNASQLSEISQCIDLKRTVPQYACSAGGSAVAGVLSKADIKSFYNKCA